MANRSRLRADIISVLDHEWRGRSALIEKMGQWSKTSVVLHLNQMVAEGLLDTRLVRTPLGEMREWRLKATKETNVTNIYEGKADARQSDDTKMPTSRFRPRYRALTDDERKLHDDIKAKAAELEALYEKVVPGRYRALGITALEESVMWVVKELTS